MLSVGLHPSLVNVHSPAAAMTLGLSRHSEFDGDPQFLTLQGVHGQRMLRLADARFDTPSNGKQLHSYAKLMDRPYLRPVTVVATLGPASDPVLEDLIRAGVGVVRLNFSHGTAEEHVERARGVRAIAKELGVKVAVLADLQGPKIRVGAFGEDGKGVVQLKNGQSFVIDPARTTPGDEGGVSTGYASLPEEVKVDDRLLLNDGTIQLRVTAIRDTAIHCVVEMGGELSSKKGINLKGGGLSAPALTDKDEQDILTAAGLGADLVAVSFVKGEDDMRAARKLVNAATLPGQTPAGLVAKLEQYVAVEHPVLNGVIKESDGGVMVARGDLADEVSAPSVPAVQRRIIHAADGRFVIVATQAVESMVRSHVPTRAELSDVARSVELGASAVMLSAESATGDYPVKTVEMVGATVNKTAEELMEEGAMLYPGADRRTHAA